LLFTEAADDTGVRPLTCLSFCVLLGEAALGQDAARTRVVESIVPWLAGNSSCWSAVELQNLGNREVAAEVEAHKSSGALVALLGHGGIQVRLRAGGRAEYRLDLRKETSGAWVRVREIVPSPQLSPVLAVSGATECLGGEELDTTVREVAWPVRNPWFNGDVSEGDDGVVALINVSERQARVQGCYSSGVLYSVPGGGQPGELTPLCSATIDEMVPPFGTRQFPVVRGGNSHFALVARGDAIVIQMLRPAGSAVRVFRVDSTITFGEEAPGADAPLAEANRKR